MGNARVLVKAKSIARLARNAGPGQVMSFASLQRKTQPIGEFDSDLTIRICGGGHLRASHSALRGHPAATQSHSSSARQSVDRPIRTGRGIHPAASHVRQVRKDLPHVLAAWRAVNSSGTGAGPAGGPGAGAGSQLTLGLINTAPLLSSACPFGQRAFHSLDLEKQFPAYAKAGNPPGFGFSLQPDQTQTESL
ncbi:MAG TPA: hypothetical protein VGZ25_14630 [Gemmataceae bacterium]|jgi:hypothetical protein|nr:hypothetical protein [Gemmataceae bacterium]